MNLLSIPLNENTDSKRKKTQQHLVYIKNLDLFMRKRTGVRKSMDKRQLCMKCLNFFKDENTLKTHKLACNNPRGQAEFFPQPGDCIEFKDWNRKFENEVCGFLDFETIQVDDPETPGIKKMAAYQYGLVFVDKENNIIFEKRESAPKGNAGDLCLETLLEIEDQLFNHARRKKEMVLTTEDRMKIRETKNCHICEEEFQKNDEKVNDHDHYTSRFIGVAHRKCNLQRRRQSQISIYMHNGSAFDFHFLITHKLRDERIKRLTGLPNTEERLRTLRINDYVMKDSLAFLSELSNTMLLIKNIFTKVILF